MLAWQRDFAPLLYPFSRIYAGIMALRRRLQTPRGLVLPAPVISVGNISWGGTGKSPLVDWLLTWAERRQLTAVVLTRGYGAKPPFRPWPVQPGSSAAHSGDEPLMLAGRHPGALVVADPKRSRGATLALNLISPQLFILDDGFQHLALARDLNLALLTPEDLEQDWNRVIPAGTWREGAGALAAAHAFLIKLSHPAEWADLRPLAQKRLGRLGRPIFPFSLEISHLAPASPLANETRRAVAETPRKGRPYRLITGVGRPEQARASAARFMGLPPEEHHIFPDHHPFTPQDLAPFFPGGAKGGLPLLCTTKDAPKLQAIPHLWAMHAEPVFLEPFAAWWELWWQQKQRTQCEPSHD